MGAIKNEAIDDIIAELQRFSTDMLSLGGSINDDRIEQFESVINFQLPDDFKYFMQKVNGLDMMGTAVFPFDVSDPGAIERAYHYEHFEVAVPQYTHIVPFSPDGSGNFYCLDLSLCTQNSETCPVVFWVSNYAYTESDQPEVVNTDFGDWIRQVIIAWTLEEYDYAGNRL